jgi:superfamily II RNA helicase
MPPSGGVGRRAREADGTVIFQWAGARHAPREARELSTKREENELGGK